MQKVKNIDVGLFIRGVKLTSNIEKFINANKKLIKSERELLEFILRYNLFNNEMDYKYFKEFFNLKSYFEGLLNFLDILKRNG